VAGDPAGPQLACQATSNSTAIMSHVVVTVVCTMVRGGIAAAVARRL
jgi:hypothetical protein